MNSEVVKDDLPRLPHRLRLGQFDVEATRARRVRRRELLEHIPGGFGHCTPEWDRLAARSTNTA